MEQNPKHIPVLLQEIIELAAPAVAGVLQPRYFDGTLGRAGHLQALLQAYSALTAVVFDQDRQALEEVQAQFPFKERCQFFHKSFFEFDAREHGLFDLMLLDLGVSSPQLDEAERGFSFLREGPLDMRMNQTHPLTAATILNEFDEEDLVEIFKKYGEIFKPYRVVKAIVHDRKTKAFMSTIQLAEMIARIEGWRKKGIHPATQYFMALRIAVNNELSGLESSLPQLVAGLKSKGRLMVLTFHSLEDRIVKWAFKEELAHLGKPVFKKVIEPSEQEQKTNPRARSAKLRIFERNS